MERGYREKCKKRTLKAVLVVRGHPMFAVGSRLVVKAIGDPALKDFFS